MDIKENKERVLYTAYGFTVKAKTGTYRSSIDGHEEEVLTSIRILNEREGQTKEIYFYVSLNRFVTRECFDRNIDDFLWYLKFEKPDNYCIETNFYYAFVENSCLFSYKIRQRKQREKLLKARFLKG